MDFPTAPYGIRYDHRNLRYFEVYEDGTVNQISNDRHAIERHEENSLCQAYFRALDKECTLYVAFADENNHISIYRVEDLEALADSVGIARPSDHVHDIRWSYSKDDPGEGRHALLDIEFLCGCELSSLNSRIMKEELKELFGWDVIHSSINSIPESKKRIKVERKSIKK